MDRKDWLSYNKKNIGWGVGIGVMTILMLSYWLISKPDLIQQMLQP